MTPDRRHIATFALGLFKHAASGEQDKHCQHGCCPGRHRAVPNLPGQLGEHDND